jgi:HSP20 family protein
MNLVTYEPWRALDNLRREVNTLFNDGLPEWAAGDSVPSLAASHWNPAVDIREEADQFVLSADVPGVNPDDISVTMENGVLTISGERHQEKVDDGDNYRRVERRYGSFHRRFSLPSSADADNISAQSRNGILEVVIPKTEQGKSKRIEVKA